MAVYNTNHPDLRWGYSVRVYPMQPSFQEMKELVDQASVMPKSSPHMLRVDADLVFMNVVPDANQYKEGYTFTAQFGCCYGCCIVKASV